ncbi:MAG TPA: hypothetical protein PKK00_08950 [Bacteroidales bacterium]|nr:hypothetical protein [Bacteroidales bacterium]HPS17339.1 hypothetical protein [Bacteroidales bacterium]
MSGYTIITEYPLWFLILCVILGAGLSTLLYFRNKKYVFTSKIKKILFVLRFLAITIIAFLLLSPLVETISRNVEKPIIIIAQDNSRSIIINKDSAFYKNSYPEKMKSFIDKVSDKFEIKTYNFGEKFSDSLSFSYKDKTTDISSLFDELQTRYTNRNVGALILATDGLYNKGKNPLYASGFASFPIYTVALGDTMIYKDLIITKVNSNKVAYLGNKFPVEIIITANKCKGSSTKLSVTKGNETVFEKSLDINSESFIQTINLEIEAKYSGLQHYHVSISALKDEITTANNFQDFYVDVLDQKQKILILANSPSPDVAAIKESLEKNNNYEVDFYLADNFTKSIKGYNLVVLHQLPSAKNNITNITDAIKKENLPSIYILGSQNNYTAFNGLKTGLNIIVNTKTSQNEAMPVINNEFPLFLISDELKRFTDDMPPLYSPFGTYNVSNTSNILFYQKIGAVSTKQPLILFNELNGLKTCVIAGEGIWKWKIFDYAKNQNHEIFNGLISKIVQYLAVTENKSLFKITCNHKFYENENVEFDAEVYNESYELINEPEVSLTIYDSLNKKYPFTFSKTSNAYSLNAGLFPVGAYRYEANVKIGDKILTQKGVFNVIAINIESLHTIADHKTLYSIAEKHGGKLYYPNQLDDLLKALEKRDDIKSVSFTQKRLSDLLNLFWVFIIILGLISAEWFIRKWSGNY